MAVIRNIVVKIGADISELQKGLQNTQKSLNKTSKKLTGLGSKLSTSLTLPLAAASAGLLKLGLNFNEAFNNIRVGTGATGAALESLKDDFKAVYTSVPTDIQSAAKAIADLNTRTGLAGKPLQELSAQMLNLSRISGEDLSGMIANSTRLFGDWSISADKTGSTMDYLFKVSQATGIGFNELNAKLVQFGAPLRQMGFDLKSSAAMLGKFEKEGVNTELVLGGLRIALGKMAKEGIKDTGQALAEVSKRIKEAGSTGEANAIALELFGTRIGPDMAAAIREGRFEINELIGSLKNSKESINGVAFETMTFAEQLQLMKNKLAVALEPLGSAFMQTLNNAMPTVGAFANKISILIKSFNNFPSSVKASIAVLLGIVAAIGPLLAVFGGLVSTFSALIGVLSLILSPVTLVIAVIVALAAVLVELWKSNEAFKNSAIRIWDEIATAVNSALENIKVWWEQYGPDILASISLVFNAIWTVVSTVLLQIWTSLQVFFNQAQPLWEDLKELFRSLGDVIQQLWQLLEPVFLAFGAIIAVLAGIWMGAVNGIIQSLAPLMDGVINAVNIIVDALGLVIALLNGDWAAAWEFMKSIAENSWQLIKNIFTAILNFVKGFVQGIIASFKGLWYALVGGSIIPDIVNGALKWFQKLLSGVKQTIAVLVSSVKKAFNSISNIIQTVVRSAWQWGANLTYSLAKGIRSGISAVGSAVRSVANKIKGFLGFSSPTKEGPGRESDEWMPNMISMFESGIKKGLPDIRSAAMEVAGSLSAIANTNPLKAAVTPGEIVNQTSSLQIGKLISVDKMEMANDMDVYKLSQKIADLLKEQMYLAGVKL